MMLSDERWWRARAQEVQLVIGTWVLLHTPWSRQTTLCVLDGLALACALGCVWVLLS